MPSNRLLLGVFVHSAWDFFASLGMQPMQHSMAEPALPAPNRRPSDRLLLGVSCAHFGAEPFRTRFVRAPASDALGRRAHSAVGRTPSGAFGRQERSAVRMQGASALRRRKRSTAGGALRGGRSATRPGGPRLLPGAHGGPRRPRRGRRGAGAPREPRGRKRARRAASSRSGSRHPPCRGRPLR